MVAGGIAVNAYGYLRLTKDIDFIIELAPQNVIEAFAALNTLGYHPIVAITAQQLADADNRRRWISEKEMKVLQFWSDQHPGTPVDLLIDVPFDFEAELARATRKELRGVGAIPIVTLPSKTDQVMSKKSEDADWDLTTWQGSRREQIRRWSKLTMDEILAAQEELAALVDELKSDNGPQTTDN